MMNSLDLLVIVFMAIAAAALLSLTLMFLARRPRVKQVCLYIASALGIYTGSVGIRIGLVGFPVQTAFGFVAAAAGIGAIVLERLSKGDKKKLMISRIVSAASLVVGILSAFIV